MDSSKFSYCTSNFLLFSLLPLQYCSNLLLIFPAKVFVDLDHYFDNLFSKIYNNASADDDLQK